MTREDIIRMARAAGFDDFFCRDLMLERFAVLVAEAERERTTIGAIHTCHFECDRPGCVAVRKAVDAEREAICQIVYGLCVSDNNAQEIVNAIRARGSK